MKSTKTNCKNCEIYAQIKNILQEQAQIAKQRDMLKVENEGLRRQLREKVHSH